MRIDRQIAIWAGWIAGPAFGVAMMAAPGYLELQPLLSGLLFWGGIAVFLITVVVVVILSIHDERRQPRVLWPIITMAVGLVIFCGGAAWPTHSEIIATLTDWVNFPVRAVLQFRQAFVLAMF
jgi:hypothetical protein